MTAIGQLHDKEYILKILTCFYTLVFRYLVGVHRFRVSAVTECSNKKPPRLETRSKPYFKTIGMKNQYHK